MKKAICIMLFLPLVIKAQYDSIGIKWVHGVSWDKIKEKAKTENKYIFFDCYTTWCVPCKKMDSEVFSNDTVADFMNDKFISVKVQMDRIKSGNLYDKPVSLELKEVAEKFKISYFPTFLFFNPEGEIVHRAGSYNQSSSFIAIAKKAMDPKFQFYSLLKVYEQGRKDYRRLPYLISLSKKINNVALTKRLLSDYMTYLDKLDQDRLFTRERIEIIASDLKTTNSRYFDLFYKNGSKVNSIMGQSGYARRTVDSVITREFIQPVIEAAPKGVEPNWNKIQDEITSKFGKEYAERTILWSRSRWCDTHKDIKGYTKYFIELVEKNGIDTSFGDSDGWLNYVADANIFKLSSDSFQINSAIKWMEGVVRRNVFDPPYFPIDTYSQLLYKAGRKKEAIYWMEEIKRMGVLKNSKNAIDFGQYYLDIMNADQITWPADFSGRWILLDKSVISGNEYVESVPAKFEVLQNADSIFFKVMEMEKNGIKFSNDAFEKKSLAMNGDPQTTFINNNSTRTRYLKWWGDNTKLIINNILNSNEIDFRLLQEIWTLSSDGNKLFIKSKAMDSNSHNWEISAIYKRGDL